MIDSHPRIIEYAGFLSRNKRGLDTVPTLYRQSSLLNERLLTRSSNPS